MPGFESWFCYSLDSGLQLSYLEMGYNSNYFMGLLGVFKELMDIKCLNSAWRIVSAVEGVDLLLPCWAYLYLYVAIESSRVIVLPGE